MRLKVEPVRRYIAAERTLVAVTSGVTAAMHVEEGAVTEHCTACAHEHRLSLTEIGQNLLVGEVCQQVHKMGVRIITTPSSCISHLYCYIRSRYLPENKYTTCIVWADLYIFSILN